GCLPALTGPLWTACPLRATPSKKQYEASAGLTRAHLPQVWPMGTILASKTGEIPIGDSSAVRNDYRKRLRAPNLYPGKNGKYSTKFDKGKLERTPRRILIRRGAAAAQPLGAG